MPGLVINGEEILIPGLEVINFLDDPRLKLKREDYRPRATRWIRSLYWHTTKGKWPVQLKPGAGPDTKVEVRIGRLWSTDGRNAGAHLSIDHDLTIGCHADLLLDAAFAVGCANEVSISGELYQGPNNEVYEDQLKVAVELTDFVTAYFSIQRQIPAPDCRGLIKRCTSGRGSKSIVGVFGHRNQTKNRGPGDPGDQIFEYLEDVGYQVFDFNANEDIDHWKKLQQDLLDYDPEDADGIPGTQTADGLRFIGYANGLWYPPEELRPAYP
jgi:hypothetical protein